MEAHVLMGWVGLVLTNKTYKDLGLPGLRAKTPNGKINSAKPLVSVCRSTQLTLLSAQVLTLIANNRYQQKL
jgi:hypothetical protein